MTSEATFYKRAEEGLYRLLELAPVGATQMGEHRWDDRLSDSTPAGLEAVRQTIRESLAEMEAMDTSGFSLDASVDHALIQYILRAMARRDEKSQDYLRDPGGYIGEALGGVFMLIVRDFAPLPQRLRSALGRVRETPRVLREGMANLVPARVPRLWAELAIQQAEQGIGLFTGLLPGIAAQAAPELLPDLQAAGQAAVAAIQEYIGFLQAEVLPQAAGDFAAGKELFDEILREEHLVDYDADQLLATGWKLFHETQAQLAAVAREIDPQKNARELLEEAKADHPTAEGLLAAYQESMEAARRFVIEHEIATIPEGESLRIVETPPFQRMFLPYAAYNPPGILEEKLEGLFWVTPVDPNAPPEQQEQKLRGHYWAKLPITALHEGYPGHHLQLVWSNRHKEVARRMSPFLSSLFIEGWAFYCEGLMEELGFLDKPIQKLGRLSDQLWRAARIILDASLHTRGMTVQEGIDFLVRECGLEPADAAAEVARYTQSPTQPQSYLMGKLAILDVVADFRRAHPDYSMREVHDAILGCGSMPPRLMRQLLGLSRSC